jgi:hypothetical protein
MKRLSFALMILLAATVAACGDDDNPTSPSGPPNTVRFTAQLSPANEVPPVTNADASASGTTTVTLNLTRDGAGTITAATVDMTTTVTGFVAGTVVTAGHIHRAPAGSNAGVLLGQFASGEFVLTNGAGSITRTGLTMSPTDAQGMIDNPAGHYFNVHTQLNPPGAIRGQLSRTQ